MPKPNLNYFVDHQNVSKDVDISMFFEGQTRDKPGTNQGQTGDKPETNRGQTRDKPETNQGQTGDKPTYNIDISIAQLRGVQRQILMFFYDNCVTNNSLKTQPMTLNEISHELRLKKETAKKSIQRLIDKKLIKRVLYQCGRRSFSIFQFSKVTINKIRDKPGTNEAARSSSILYTNKYNTKDTTTTPLRSVSMVKRFQESVNSKIEIDISPLSDINLNHSHIQQLLKLGVCKDIIQESINAFAYDLQNGYRKKTDFKISPIAFLIGVLKNNDPYIAHLSFYNKEKQALEDLKQRKKDLDDIIYQQNKIKFDLWLSKLSHNEQINILGLNTKEVEKLLPEMKNKMLFKYYVERCLINN